MLVRSLPNNQLNNKFLSITEVSNEKVSLTDDDIETKAKQQEIDNNPEEWSIIEGSTGCRQAINRIRKVFEAIGKIPFNKEKVPIRMDMGDPTVGRNIGPHENMITAVENALREGIFNGYLPPAGANCAREAVAKRYTHSEALITSDDVIITSGCSHALDLSISALSECGKTILLPDPGFPLYGALCKKYNVETRTYPISMEEGVIDLKRLEEQIDKNTIAMIVNNPMNPAGIVFSKSHLEEVLKIAYKHKIIIIADEIYGDLTFNNATFHPLATLSPKVPIICCDGISKRYLVPGWRLGWLIFYNRYNVLDEIKVIILSYTQHLMGACAILQGALPAILEKTPITFKESTCKLLQNNADIICNKLSGITGLKPLKPYGAMYMMVKLDPEIYGNEWKLIEDLIKEESVYCFHGSLFNAPNWFRMLLTFPEEVTKEACDRIALSCFKKLQNKDEQSI